MRLSDNFIEVDKRLGLDNNRVWYYIEGYNGYELSNDGYLRSMKHYKKYPYGILLRGTTDKKTGDIIYELTDDQNQRVHIGLSTLSIIAQNSSYNIDHANGYPRRTSITDIASRNQKCSIHPKSVNSKLKEYHKVSFTIID